MSDSLYGLKYQLSVLNIPSLSADLARHAKIERSVE